MRSRLVRGLSAALTSSLLAACGGGGGGGDGGGNLQVDISYDLTGANAPQIWTQSTVLPTITGLDGHAPHCTLTSGKLPAGVTIGASNCAITGAPQETGTFPINVTMTVGGATGSVDAPAVYVVPALAMSYANFSMTWGMHGGPQTPTIAGYTAQAGDTISYAFASPGSGLSDQQAYYTLDAATGSLDGTPIGDPTLGYPALYVEATIVRNGYKVKAKFDDLEANAQFGPAVTFPQVSQIQVGVPFTITPSAPPFADLGFSVVYAANPSGSNSCNFATTVDPATGAISGTMTLDAGGCFVSIGFTATKGTLVIKGGATATLS
jgi:hypothetical protein